MTLLYLLHWLTFQKTEFNTLAEQPLNTCPINVWSLDSTPYVTTECGLDFRSWSSCKRILQKVIGHYLTTTLFPHPCRDTFKFKDRGTFSGKLPAGSHLRISLYTLNITWHVKPQQRTHPFKCGGFHIQSLSDSACEDNALITLSRPVKKNIPRPTLLGKVDVNFRHAVSLAKLHWALSLGGIHHFCCLMKFDINWRDKASRFPLTVNDDLMFDTKSQRSSYSLLVVSVYVLRCLLAAVKTRNQLKSNRFPDLWARGKFLSHYCRLPS